MRLERLTVQGEANGMAQLNTDGVLLRAGAQTDWFFHPAGSFRRDNVIAASMAIEDAVFTLSAKVSVRFSSAFDAGALFVQVDDDNWAKLAFELSGAGLPTVVSVITRGVSDDADGPSIEGESVWLRVHCDGQTLAFHFSVDGLYWRFLRWFTLPGIARRPLRIGFAAQAPTGEGCVARFTDMGWSLQQIVDLRDGS
ncbi:DUF1349 domain-containing protein [Pseudomonas citrulli]|uniref:DUF1349 domain-containing protein n=1 Tax=Pseudomonas citrulli TaxID=3064347 RepID=A0ABT9BYA0_9PSED|nr:DUF1349 domain-containing protein [Pseudomonas sp. K18]MDO7897529.1 DUF1349 domain-containing protein [Pseudomonas sp. K18]